MTYLEARCKRPLYLISMGPLNPSEISDSISTQKFDAFPVMRTGPSLHCHQKNIRRLQTSHYLYWWRSCYLYSNFISTKTVLHAVHCFSVHYGWSVISQVQRFLSACCWRWKKYTGSSSAWAFDVACNSLTCSCYILIRRTEYKWIFSFPQHYNRIKRLLKFPLIVGRVFAESTATGTITRKSRLFNESGEYFRYGITP